MSAMSVLNSKILTMVCLGTSSIVTGLLPAWCIPINSISSTSLFVSVLLCFGSGILLGTSMVHMLTEVQENLPHSANIIACLGFLLLYFLEEMISALKGGNKHQVKQCERYHEMYFENYGAVASSEETRRLMTATPTRQSDNDLLTRCSCEGDGTMCHISSQMIQQTPNVSSHIGLILALSIHSILEGLAIGVQTDTSHILILGGAVASHKLVVSFCLGMELMATQDPDNLTTKLNVLTSVIIFSLSSVIGIGIGMFLTEQTLLVNVNSNIVTILQAIAVGTLMYVTLSEVLPRERYRFHHGNSTKWYTGIVQFFAVLFGFGVITAITLLLGSHTHTEEIPPN